MKTVEVKMTVFMKVSDDFDITEDFDTLEYDLHNRVYERMPHVLNTWIDSIEEQE